MDMLKHVFDLLLVHLSSVQVSHRSQYYNVTSCIALIVHHSLFDKLPSTRARSK